jgi:Xaa-Pro aminopeptidase
MDPAEFAVRRANLLRRLGQQRLDALIVSALPNVRYLTGFTGSNAMLVLAPEAEILLTDARYGTQALRETACRVRVVRGALAKAAAGLLKRRRWTRVGFEAARLSYSAYEMLRESVPGRVRLAGLTHLIEELRALKSPAEIALIRQSVATAEQAFARVAPGIRPGIAESELAAEIDYQMRRLGAERPAFETIVAAGERTALPHAAATTNRLAAGGLVLIDMGAQRNGYASDLTRMAYLGRPPRKVTRLYEAVREAQLAALDAVRAGVSAATVDRRARQTLHRFGLDRLFVHSTGHGLGLEIHEPPRLAAGERTRLEAGMVVTIEPGAYEPGFGGVRLEDTVLVTPSGCEILTTTAKELLVI